MSLRVLAVWALYLLLAAVCVLVLLPLLYVGMWGSRQMTTAEAVESRPVAIVFGAASWWGRPSPVFADRLRTAAELYAAGKVETILVSGHHAEGDYSEPVTGKAFLAGELKIPQEAIVLDYAGLRTYDTCARAVQVFAVDEAILVTQLFHLPRALFTCHAFGIDGIGVPADRRRYRDINWYRLREQAARFAAFWEATLFRHPPTIMGPPMPISSTP